MDRIGKVILMIGLIILWVIEINKGRNRRWK